MFSYVDIGQGEVVVLLHGLGNRKEAWNPQHLLSDDYRLIIPDLIGHGESPIKEDLTLSHATNNIIDLLDHLGIERVHLCGLSLGGIIAQNIYRLFPNRIQSLILADTCSYIPFFSSFLMTRKQQMDLIEEDVLTFKQKAIHHCLHNPDPTIHHLGKKAFFIHTDTYIPCATMASGYNFYPLLPFIGAPVLLLCGDEDKVTPTIHIHTMHMLLPYSSLKIIPEAGHLSNIEQPAVFNEHIRHFLTNPPQGALSV